MSEYDYKIQVSNKKQAKKLILILCEIGYKVYYYPDDKEVCFVGGVEELPYSIRKMLEDSGIKE